MKDKNLLMKCVILLYKETLLKSKGLSSVDKINKVIEDVSSRVSPDLGGNVQNLDKIVNSNLIFRIREMAELGPEHEYDQTEFLNDLELDCDEDKLLFKVLKESILKDHTEEELKKHVISLRRSIDNHYREKEISDIIEKANYMFKFKRDTIPNMSEYLSRLVADIDRLNNTTTKDPSITSEIDLSAKKEVEDVFKLAIDKNSNEGIMKTGWQALNTALQGGFRRGEFVCISSLAHKWKTGFTMSIFKQIALYNKPYMLDMNKKPLLVRISAEDDIEANVQLLYQSLKYTETREVVDISKTSPNEMSAYIHDKLSANGYHIKLLRVDPTDWSYSKLLNKLTEYESEGYEIHCCMLDYLSLLSRDGCLQLAGTGSDLRDMYRRVRNFVSTRRILFITPHQLSTTASQLLRGTISEEDFTKFVAGKNLYDSCGKLSQEFDVGIILHSFNKNDKRYLSITIEKHRLPTYIADYKKSYYMEYPSNGMPIRDDINEEDCSFRAFSAKQSGGNANDDLFEF